VQADGGGVRGEAYSLRSCDELPPDADDDDDDEEEEEGASFALESFMQAVPLSAAWLGSMLALESCATGSNPYTLQKRSCNSKPVMHLSPFVVGLVVHHPARDGVGWRRRLIGEEGGHVRVGEGHRPQLHVGDVPDEHA
jgi:hypothetical protein